MEIESAVQEQTRKDPLSIGFVYNSLLIMNRHFIPHCTTGAYLLQLPALLAPDAEHSLIKHEHFRSSIQAHSGHYR